MSAADRDTQATQQYHAMLNNYNAQGGTERPYVSQAQAQWDLERKGNLPSQQDENNRRVRDYATKNGVSEHAARQSLSESRGLVHQDREPPPAPPSFKSAADEQAVMGATLRDGAEASRSGGSKTAPTVEEVKARMEAEGKLPSQGFKA